MDNQDLDNQRQEQNPSVDDASKEHVKQRALKALMPLVDQLEESPQRKFEIIMTALRASEERSLLEKALDTAMQIEDPSVKADALLDVINEADYQEQG
jgi:hypothetical protein